VHLAELPGSTYEEMSDTANTINQIGRALDFDEDTRQSLARLLAKVMEADRRSDCDGLFPPRVATAALEKPSAHVGLLRGGCIGIPATATASSLRRISEHPGPRMRSRSKNFPVLAGTR
jgi:hypothetical protein